tara:strand:- start:16 stop:357 length:342 start_codon:yes stop_codon:yes gene_type:complete
MSTIFKDIIDKKINAEIIYETEDIIAFKDINAVAPHHYLIIPKKEIKNVNNIEKNDQLILGGLFIAAKKIAKKLNFDKNGYRLIVNCNEDGGQTVYHLHMHIIAGRKFNWPPG